jgi:hypothetical protein
MGRYTSESKEVTILLGEEYSLGELDAGIVSSYPETKDD